MGALGPKLDRGRLLGGLGSCFVSLFEVDFSDDACVQWVASTGIKVVSSVVSQWRSLVSHVLLAVAIGGAWGASSNGQSTVGFHSMVERFQQPEFPVND